MRRSIKCVALSAPLLVGMLCLAGCDAPPVPADKNSTIQIQKANGPNPSPPNLPGPGSGGPGSGGPGSTAPGSTAPGAGGATGGGTGH